jgi:hypothetical protein
VRSQGTPAVIHHGLMPMMNDTGTSSASNQRSTPSASWARSALSAIPSVRADID